MIRKITLSVFVFAVALTTTVSAQVRFGAKAGLNIATVAVDGKTEGAESKIGFHVGAVADYKLTDKYSIQSGLLFSQKGVKVKGADISSTQNYIEVPVNVAYTHDLGNSKLSGFVGPYFAFAVNGEEKWGSETTKYEYKKDVDGRNRFDLGLNAGLNYDFSNYRVTAQYGLGLTEMTEKGKDTNRVIGLSFSYFFGK